MYICESCQEQITAGIPSTLVTTETRFRAYWGHQVDPKTQKKRRILIGKGWEIVRQKRMCPTCAQTHPPHKGASTPEDFDLRIGDEPNHLRR